MRTVALLLDDPENRYQQILGPEAEASTEEHQVRILPVEYAEGSSWSQPTLRRYWDRGERPGETILLDATSFPPLETLRVR